MRSAFAGDCRVHVFRLLQNLQRHLMTQKGSTAQNCHGCKNMLVIFAIRAQKQNHRFTRTFRNITYTYLYIYMVYMYI